MMDSTQDVTALVQSETNNNDGSMKGLENYPKARALFDYSAEVHGDLTLRVGVWIEYHTFECFVVE